MRQSLNLVSAKLTFRHTVSLAFVSAEGGYFFGKLNHTTHYFTATNTRNDTETIFAAAKFGWKVVFGNMLSFGGSVTTTYLTEENIYMLLRLSGWTYPASASVQ